MGILPVSTLLKYLVTIIISLLIMINGCNWEKQHQKTLQIKNDQKILHILKYPEQIKGCKL